MSVIPITLALSVGLVFLFVWFFIRERARAGKSSAERDALLPLADENPHVKDKVGDQPHVISFAGYEPGTIKRHAHSGGCDKGKPEHERCPDCPSRKTGKT